MELGKVFQGYRPDIQGLRALAVLFVIANHINSKWLPGGYFGVDIFFVISGYVVGGNLIRNFNVEGFSIVRFYKDRILRIAPAYLWMLAITSALASIVMLPKDFKFFLDSLSWSLLFLSNYFFANFGDYFAPESYELPLLHTWSLAIEMQFYLILPIAFLFLSKAFKSVKHLVWIIAAFSAFLVLTDSNGNSGYFTFSKRLPEFSIGMILASSSYLQRSCCSGAIIKTALSVIGSVLIIFGLFFPQNSNITYLAPCVGAACLIQTKGGVGRRILESKFFVFIGFVSYSLYLWHWPVLSIVRYVTQEYIMPIGVLVIAIALIFILSYGSFKYIESPWRLKGVVATKNWTRRIISILAALLVMVISLYANAQNNDSKDGTQDVPIEQTRYADQKTICHGQIVGDCYRGSAIAKKTVLVIGDSHAAQLNLALDRIGSLESIRFKVVTGSSCMPIQGFKIENIPEYSRAACKDQVNYIAKNLNKYQDVVIAGKWSYLLKNDYFVPAFLDFIKDLRKRNVRVVVISQIPMFKKDVQRQSRLSGLGFLQNYGQDETVILSNNILKSAIANIKGAVFLNVDGLPMFKDAPYFKGRLMYSDSHHLNELGSFEFGEEVSKMLADSLMGSVHEK